MPVDETENIVGAIVFFFYILAALLLSGLLINNLITTWSRKSRQSFQTRQRIGIKNASPVKNARTPGNKVAITATITGISFATLSFHMLNFLVQSYMRWSSAQISNGLMLDHSTGSTWEIMRSLQIWKWPKGSTLFKDFAVVISKDPRRLWWTQLVLLYTMAWNMLMSVVGECQ